MSIWAEASFIDLATDPGWEQLWEQGDALLLYVSSAGNIATIGLSEGGDSLQSSSDVPHLKMLSSADVSYDSVRHLYLGQIRGTPIFASIGEVPQQVNLRQVLAHLSGVDIEIALRANALVQYHQTHRFCAQCGALTRTEDLGRSRRCDICNVVHFPRIDPAIIVAVIDERNRLLLAHNGDWENKRYSILAGFVEAGESLEQAVMREIAEEVNLEVTDIRYAGSQPWPMPRALMVGFIAKAGQGSPRPDGVEITTARWFNREDLRIAITCGELTLPMPASIAYRMISQWFGKQLPGS